jgi:hypothetical protein
MHGCYINHSLRWLAVSWRILKILNVYETKAGFVTKYVIQSSLEIVKTRVKYSSNNVLGILKLVGLGRKERLSC